MEKIYRFFLTIEIFGIIIPKKALKYSFLHFSLSVIYERRTPKTFIRSGPQIAAAPGATAPEKWCVLPHVLRSHQMGLRRCCRQGVWHQRPKAVDFQGFSYHRAFSQGGYADAAAFQAGRSHQHRKIQPSRPRDRGLAAGI